MATLICRSLTNIARRTALVACSRASSGDTDLPMSGFDQHKGKIASDQVSMPDALGHAVGLERYELLAKLAGNDDPFDMKVGTMGAGTLEDPTLVDSVVETRIVGCMCDEDSLSINWMRLNKGETKRCECGYFFKIREIQPIDYTKLIPE